MSKERYVEHTVAWELPIRDSVTKGNYNLADIETKYLPIQTEVVSDNKDKTINKLQQRIAELEEQLKNAIVLPKELHIGCKIFWANEDGVYSGKLCAVTKDIKPNGDVNIWLYCLYDNGLSYSHLIKDFEVELFATEEEAQLKLKKLKGEKK